MNNKILCMFALIITTLITPLFAQKQYSLYEVKQIPEAKKVLAHRPFLWIGPASANAKKTSATGKVKINNYGVKKACQYAAIKALQDLQTIANKKQFIIISNLHSNGARTGLFYCRVSDNSVKVRITGTLKNQGL